MAKKKTTETAENAAVNQESKEPKKKQEQPDRIGAFAALNAQLLACEDEAQRAQIPRNSAIRLTPCFIKPRYISPAPGKSEQINVKNPFFLCSIKLETPPTSDATIGVPKSIASPIELGEFSIEEGEIKTLDNKNRSFICSALNCPKKIMFSSNFHFEQ